MSLPEDQWASARYESPSHLLALRTFRCPTIIWLLKFSSTSASGVAATGERHQGAEHPSPCSDHGTSPSTKISAVQHAHLQQHAQSNLPRETTREREREIEIKRDQERQRAIKRDNTRDRERER